MGVSTPLALVLTSIGMHHCYSALYGLWKMEEATTKASKEEVKLDKVHAHLLTDYPPCSLNRQNLVKRQQAKDYQLVDGQVHYVGHMKRCEGEKIGG